MVLRKLTTALLLGLALPALAYAADDGMAGMDMSSHDSAAANPMGGMNMKMTLPPMPAIYAGEADKPGAPLFGDTYGTHHHAITTSNPQTQMFFDQGVRLLFAFNHAEAIRSFREGARLDPNCAMCWWGVAFALGSNINLPIQPDAPGPAVAALQMAQALKPKVSAEEGAWIDALTVRYSTAPGADQHAMDEAFATEMGKLWAKYPNDLDAGTFYAESMMDTQPWDYWQEDGKTPKGHGAEIVSTLEGILAKEPLHPGALHLYIHAVEASTTPERAEAAADKLEPLMPAAGHVVHMPSHIYFRVGRYEDSMKVNALAATKDEEYIAACRAQGFYPLAYYSHNIHFLWTSSEMMGDYKSAEDAARRVSANGMKGAPLAEHLPPVQLYLFVPIVTDIRFGKWDKALAEPRPKDELKLDKAISLYARGWAFANMHDLKHAAEDRALLAKMIDSKEMAGIDAFGFPGTAMAQLGLTLLDGEIARVKGDMTTALAQFKNASDMYDTLPYTEPDYWHQPVSHIYGAALLQAGKPAEAEAVYRASLKEHRIDGWALFGLAQALEAQGKKDEAKTIRAEFTKTWRLADVKLTSSRF
jgi:tetratricopeptide (TPR) repeat protein